MGRRYDYVVLDMDGTLYSHRKYVRACNRASRRLEQYARDGGCLLRCYHK